MNSDYKTGLGFATILAAFLAFALFKGCESERLKDNTPIIETCVKHPAARSVHVN